MHLPATFYEERKLENLVENRTTYTVESAELNIYETLHFEEAVVLQFDQPVFASMIKGKKKMYLRGINPFDFLPGESLIMPANEIMKIDFPEASLNTPTECLAMTISPDKIRSIVDDMNRFKPRVDSQEWRLTDDNFAFANDPAVSHIIQRLIYLFAENHPSKDFFVDMNLKELIMRVIQADNRLALSNGYLSQASNSRMAAAIYYIKKHLDRPLSIKELAREACMSESSFYKTFKQELGKTPVQFINDARIEKARELLMDPSIKIKDIYLMCGFTNLSYFIRMFKKYFDQTPGEFRMKPMALA